MAVYTEITDDQLQEFLAEYEIGKATSCKGIAEGVENSNYLLRTQRDDVGSTFILTLYEKRVAPEDLPYFLGLMDHLASRGFTCPTPVKGRDGKALRELAERPAAIITFLDGMWPKHIAPDHCRLLGGALANMHLLGADFAMSRRNSLSVDDWRALFEPSRARAAEVSAGLSEEIDGELDVLQADWPRHLPRGVIHADLFPDNVFFLGAELSGIIDFYFACNDAFAYDVATCLNAWCFESDNSFNITKARHLLSAYRKVRPFSDDEFDALPILARGSAMRFLLTRLHDWLHHPDGALVKPKDPLEYLHKLRFHRQVSSPAAYGLD